jgi:hypothetical protein
MSIKTKQIHNQVELLRYPNKDCNHVWQNRSSLLYVTRPSFRHNVKVAENKVGVTAI